MKLKMIFTTSLLLCAASSAYANFCPSGSTYMGTRVPGSTSSCSYGYGATLHSPSDYGAMTHSEYFSCYDSQGRSVKSGTARITQRGVTVPMSSTPCGPGLEASPEVVVEEVAPPVPGSDEPVPVPTEPQPVEPTPPTPPAPQPGEPTSPNAPVPEYPAGPGLEPDPEP